MNLKYRCGVRQADNPRVSCLTPRAVPRSELALGLDRINKADAPASSARVCPGAPQDAVPPRERELEIQLSLRLGSLAQVRAPRLLAAAAASNTIV
jgi:hypothetical protein